LRRFRSENHAQNIRKHPRHFGFKDVETNMASAGFTRPTVLLTCIRKSAGQQRSVHKKQTNIHNLSAFTSDHHGYWLCPLTTTLFRPCRLA
jgi:hypothetical protein